jgi:hypothetical protein
MRMPGPWLAWECCNPVQSALEGGRVVEKRGGVQGGWSVLKRDLGNFTGCKWCWNGSG